MTSVLRIELIVLAIIFFAIVVHNVNGKNLQLKYSLVWMLASFALVIIALVPEVVYKVTSYIGIQTPSNLIFLACLIWLIGMNLSLTVIVSRQSEKIKKITQIISLENYEHERDK